MTHLLIILFAYIIGSTPFGLILTRAAGLGDVRKIGSGSIGATNVLRTGNKKLALATLLLDAAKGAVPVLWIEAYGHGGVHLAALAAFLGHLYPFWLGFKGGKGVATGVGVLLALSWPVGLIACAIWLIVALIGRISSLAALVTAAIAPALAWHFSTRDTTATVLIMAVLVFWKHRANIRRLLGGEEPRIGAKQNA
jgi:glycerol-3-phosphate acyltransferase PlsY